MHAMYSTVYGSETVQQINFTLFRLLLEQFSDSYSCRKRYTALNYARNINRFAYICLVKHAS